MFKTSTVFVHIVFLGRYPYQKSTNLTYTSCALYFQNNSLVPLQTVPDFTFTKPADQHRMWMSIHREPLVFTVERACFLFFTSLACFNFCSRARAFIPLTTPFLAP